MCSPDLLAQVHLWSIQVPLSFSQIHGLFQLKGKSAQELCKVQLCLPTRKQGWGQGVLNNSWARLEQDKRKFKGRIVKDPPAPHRSVMTDPAGVHPCGTWGVGGSRSCLSVHWAPVNAYLKANLELLSGTLSSSPPVGEGRSPFMPGWWSCLSCWAEKCSCKPFWNFSAPTLLMGSLRSPKTKGISIP